MPELSDIVASFFRENYDFNIGIFKADRIESLLDEESISDQELTNLIVPEEIADFVIRSNQVCIKYKNVPELSVFLHSHNFMYLTDVFPNDFCNYIIESESTYADLMSQVTRWLTENEINLYNYTSNEKFLKSAEMHLREYFWSHGNQRWYASEDILFFLRNNLARSLYYQEHDDERGVVKRLRLAESQYIKALELDIPRGFKTRASEELTKLYLDLADAVPDDKLQFLHRALEQINQRIMPHREQRSDDYEYGLLSNSICYIVDTDGEGGSFEDLKMLSNIAQGLGHQYELLGIDELSRKLLDVADKGFKFLRHAELNMELNFQKLANQSKEQARLTDGNQKADNLFRAIVYRNEVIKRKQNPQIYAEQAADMHMLALLMKKKRARVNFKDKRFKSIMDNYYINILRDLTEGVRTRDEFITDMLLGAVGCYDKSEYDTIELKISRQLCSQLYGKHDSSYDNLIDSAKKLEKLQSEADGFIFPRLLSETAHAYMNAAIFAPNDKKRLDHLKKSLRMYVNCSKTDLSYDKYLGYLQSAAIRLADTYIRNSMRNHEIAVKNAKKWYKLAVKVGLRAQEFDHSDSNRSKTGYAAMEYTRLMLEHENYDIAKKSIIVAGDNIEPCAHDGFPLGIILKAKLCDISQELLPHISSDDIVKEKIEMYSQYNWDQAMENLFRLFDEGIIKFKSLYKGTGKTYRLRDKPRPLQKSMIIKEGEQSNVELMELQTKLLYSLFPETSHAVAVYHKLNRSYLFLEVIDRPDIEMAAPSLTKEVITECSKSAMLNLFSFHQRTTEHLSSKDFVLSDKKLIYRIPKYDYLDELIKRMFVGKDSNMVKKFRHIIESDNKLAFSTIPKHKYFSSRIPYTKNTFDFLKKYKTFLESSDISNGPMVVLHRDFYPSNVLTCGTIIDAKPFQTGNPLVDIAHFMSSPEIQSLTSEQQNEIMHEYYKRCSGYMQKSLESTFDIHLLHSSLCLIGALSNQMDGRAQAHYARLLSELSKPYSFHNELFALLYNTGIERIRDGIASTNPGKFFEFDHIKVPKLTIAFDYDGVIGDPTQMKYQAFHRQGYDVDPVNFTKSKAIRSGIPEEIYDAVIDEIYAGDKSRLMGYVPQTRKVLWDLQKQGHNTIIVTKRNEVQGKRTKEWMARRHYPHVDIYCTDNSPKSSIIDRESVDVIVEDSPGVLEDIMYNSRTRPILVLLTQPWNKNYDEPEGIIRIERASTLYSIVNSLVHVKPQEV